MTHLFVTGTSTEVGKTVVTAALAAVAGAVRVVKPAQTGVAPGEPGDVNEIARLSGVTDVLELARYPDPLAPDTAARVSGLAPLRFDDVLAALDAPGLTLVEGAGGLLVGLGEGGFTLLDVARELDAPVLVVAAAGLGTLNHSALTVRALLAERVPRAGIVIGSWPAAPDLATRCNVDDLPRVTGIDVVGSVPAGAGALDPAEFRRRARTWFDPEWTSRYLGR